MQALISFDRAGELGGGAVFGADADLCGSRAASRRAGAGDSDGRGGSGRLFGALTLAVRAKRARVWDALWVCRRSAFGVSLILFSFSKTFWLSVVLLIPVGYAVMLQMSGSNTLIQSMVPDELRGRAMAMYTMMFMGMAPIGSLFSGALADRDWRAIDGSTRRPGRDRWRNRSLCGVGRRCVRGARAADRARSGGERERAEVTSAIHNRRAGFSGAAVANCGGAVLLYCAALADLTRRRGD